MSGDFYTRYGMVQMQPDLTFFSVGPRSCMPFHLNSIF